MPREFKGGDVNAVLKLVKSLAGDGDDGDLELSILTVALIVACKSCGVPKDDAIAIISETFDNEANLALIPFDQIGANG